MKIEELLRISRPIYWLGPVFIYLAGLLSVPIRWDFLAIWGLLFVTFPMGIIVYGLNDISDRESDKDNNRKGGVEGFVVKDHQITFIIKIVAIVSLISIFPYLILRNYYSLVALFLIYSFAYVYSFKPFRFKSKILLDSFSNGIWFLGIYLLGFSWHISKMKDFSLMPKIVWLLFAGVMSTHLLATLWDLEPDKKAGDITTGVFLGKKNILILSAMTYAIISFLLRPMNFVIYLYLLFCCASCLIMFFISNQKIIYYLVWMIILGFPLICLYLVVFDYSFFLNLVRIES